MHTKTKSDELSLLRTRAVLDKTGLCRSSLYSQIKAGTFPPPVKISERAVAWRSTDISLWIESRNSHTPRGHHG